MRDYDQARKGVQKALEMDGNYYPALYLLARIYVQQSKLNEAIAIFQKILTMDDAPILQSALGSALALAGQLSSARDVLKDLEQRSKERYVSGTHKAVIHLALGDTNRTFECLEEALGNRCEMMTWLKVDPAYDTIRRDLRFTRLLRRVGLDRERQLQKSAAS
jgi:tetratricopeptide (TPR) repeat protein